MIPEKVAAESTDYASRAKVRMNQAVRAGALVIMPIGLAVQAHAAVTLPTNAACENPQGCSANATQLGEQNGLEGISLSGYDSEFYAGSSGGSGESTSLSMDASGLLALDSNGSTCNGIDQPCQLDSFQISFSGSLQDVSGQFGQPLQTIITSFQGAGIFVELDGTPLFSEFVPAANPNSTQVGLAGSAIVAIPGEFQNDIASLIAGSSGSNVDLSVGFSFQYTTSPPGSSLVTAGGNFSITGIDAATPEPATTGLAMGGLAGLGAWLGLGDGCAAGEPSCICPCRISAVSLLVARMRE